MKTLHLRTAICLAFGLAASLSLAQSRAYGDSPEKAAHRDLFERALAEGRALSRAGKDVEALVAFERAAGVEGALGPFPSLAYYEMASAYTRLSRVPEALEAFSRVFRWNPEKGDLDTTLAPRYHAIMEYAVLLARAGRAADAKAIYYFGLRDFNGSLERDKEPVLFLTVFDPEPEAASYDYTPERLEAAALMVTIAQSNGMRDVDGTLLERVRKLWPEWFYPVAWLAANQWNDEWGEATLRQAEALALPGVESGLMAAYRVAIGEHRAKIAAEGTPYERDTRPIREGVERRSRMSCLQPDDAVLRKLVSSP